MEIDLYKSYWGDGAPSDRWSQAYVYTSWQEPGMPRGGGVMRFQHRWLIDSEPYSAVPAINAIHALRDGLVDVPNTQLSMMSSCHPVKQQY